MDFILEIIGFSLTVVEIFYPRKAEDLENWIDSLPQKAPRLFYGNVIPAFNKATNRYLEKGPLNIEPDNNLENIKTPFVSFLYNLYKTILFSVIFGVFFGLVYLIFGESTFEQPSVIAALVFVGLALVLMILSMLISVVCFIIVSLIKIIIALLNGVSNGRAIGAIGLILASLGLVSKLF